MKEYSDYDDITKCISASLYHIKCGVRLLLNQKLSSLPICIFTKELTSNSYFEKPKHKAMERLQEIISLILEFPPITEGLPANIYKILDDSTFDAIEAVAESNKAQIGHFLVDLKRTYSLLLKCTLCKMYAYTLTRAYLNLDMFKILDRIFTVFVRIWEKKREEDKQKEEEKNKLYKYKTQEHKIETEEEREERIFRETFPDFEGYLVIYWTLETN